MKLIFNTHCLNLKTFDVEPFVFFGLKYYNFFFTNSWKLPHFLTTVQSLISLIISKLHKTFISNSDLNFEDILISFENGWIFELLSELKLNEVNMTVFYLFYLFEIA